MTADTLTHLGIDAWLQDPKGARLALSPAVVNGNLITTVIEVENPKSYCLHWCKSRDTPSINARCDVFRPVGKSGHVKIARIAHRFMAADDAQTQSRSSQGALELPLQKDAWLWTPRSGSRTGYISLEVRRLRHSPWQSVPMGNEDPELVVDELNGDEGATTPPNIIFRFDFKPKGPARSISSTISSSRRKSRHSPLLIKKTCAQSYELSDLSSSESEPERPPVDKEEHIQIDRRGEGSKTRLEPDKTLKRAPPEQDTVSVLLKKRRTIMQRQEEIEQAKQSKRTKLEKLLQDLEEDTKVRAEKLADDQNESEQIENEIKKIQAALST
ncbi:hypothetical protein DFH09DRAFT_5116 [Mycena vulgaris]|nr:hypothetical protein DFH09DRAFT_5116 [Mycena vulgaris]